MKGLKCCILLIFFTLSMALISCDKEKVDICYNKDFEFVISKSKEQKMNFCVVLLDSRSSTYESYLKKLDENKHNISKGIVNIVDITKKENRWYEELLCPNSVPLACVFTHKGELVNIIGGGMYESFMNLAKSLGKNKKNECTYRNIRLELDKYELIKFMDKMFKYTNSLNRGEDITININDIVKEKEYPYNLKLKFANECKKSDTLSAKNTCERILNYMDSYYYLLYTDLFFEAKNYLDSNYNLGTLPKIYLSNDEIDLGKCKLGQKYTAEFNIYNKGVYPLRLINVIPGCGCVSLDKNYKEFINSGDSTKLTLIFTPDVTGEVERSISVISDDINTPLVNLMIVSEVMN